MKTAVMTSMISIGVFIAPWAHASQEIANKNGCIACHAVDKKLVGPSFKEIADKYKADKGAEGKLAEKVKKGGVGVWGQVPMPPNAQVKDEDIKTLVKWILATK
jgi:cytochrome c